MLQVLVVDDAATDRIRVAGIASKWKDCNVLQAENGQTALEVVSVELPDIVLTDLHMPEMDGLELVGAIREDYPHIPVILMTGEGSEDMAASALKTGAASYVPKDRLADDLLETLEQVYSTSQASHSLSRLMHYVTESTTQFSLPNDPALLKICLDRILNMLKCLPLGDEMERIRVGIALREAISNAYFHGNLEVEDEDEDEDEEFRGDRDDWQRIASSRWYEAPYSERKVHVRADINRDRAIFVIADDGDGFDRDPEDFANAASSAGETSAGETHGRGLTLMNTIMDEVTFNEAGNEVRLVKYAIRMTEELDDALEDDEEEEDAREDDREDS